MKITIKHNIPWHMEKKKLRLLVRMTVNAIDHCLLAELTPNDLFLLSFFILEIQCYLMNNPTEIIGLYLNILQSHWEVFEQQLVSVQDQTVDAIMVCQRQTVRRQHLSLHCRAQHCWAMRAWLKPLGISHRINQHLLPVSALVSDFMQKVCDITVAA